MNLLDSSQYIEFIYTFYNFYNMFSKILRLKHASKALIPSSQQFGWLHESKQINMRDRLYKEYSKHRMKKFQMKDLHKGMDKMTSFNM